ncbi:uncharacterized protein [Littorina saxatilis]|uniref:uncharacterized protein n=1 Tax=Littorina saxatilis TaxID=31220 RepID=UPI0038B5DA74
MELCSLQALVPLIFLLTPTWCSSQCTWNGRYHNNRCQCYEGFTGANCDTDCHCEGHGVCKADGTCECETGWKWSASQHKCVWDCQHCDSGVRCIGPGECGCAHPCKWGACRNGQCVCYEGYKGDDCSHYDTNIMLNKDVAVGINIGGISYYSAEVKWVDIAKQSKAWLTQRDGVHEWDTHEIGKVTLRKDGYPASLPDGLHLGKTVYRGFGSHEETGNYTVLYDGEGTIDFGLAHFTVHYRGKGRLVVEFSQLKNSGIEIQVMETNPHNPLHNLRLVPPGYENTHLRFPFHPLFLQFLKRFSEIRFMDYLSTNAHQPEPTTWDTMKAADYHTQAGSDGGSIEYLVQLVNTVGVNAWVNMPHAADDNYVKQFATYMKQHLRPDLKVYVEYSNEVWNFNFRQNKYTQEQGTPLWPNDESWMAGRKWFVQRATEVANIWSQVWSGHDRQRMVNVITWQTRNEHNFDTMIAILGDHKSSFDALAISGYFSADKLAPKHPDQFAKMTMAEIQHACDVDLANQTHVDQHYMDMAKSLGLKLVMYEGGPGFREGNPNHDNTEVTAKAIAFNRDPHIIKPMHDVMQAWYDVVTTNASNASPGGLFNYFATTGTPSKYGSWGMTEYTGQDLSKVPKWLAVQTFISDHWPNTLLGPKCSFTQDQATNTAFGCFPSGGHYVCAKSADNGHSWTNLPSLHQSSSDHVTLDGYDVKEKKLYVRVMDRTYVSKYHVYSENTRSWTTMKSIPYFADEFAPSVIPRMPADADHGLSSQTHC